MMAKSNPSDQKDEISTKIGPDQLTSLENTSRILALLHHRNSNQHRRQHWYKSFSMLRRHLKHICHDLTITTVPSSLPTTLLPSKRREITKSCEQKVEKRLEMWKNVYVRKWFGEFSQLVADNQFAVIGLVLLGCLGRVCGVLGVTEGLLEEREDAGVALEGFAREEDLVVEHDVGVVIARDHGHDEDEGEAVSRVDDVVLVEAAEGIFEESEEVPTPVEVPKLKPTKRKTRDSPSVSAVETPNPKKAKKKKLKKRDTIDDLFSRLF